VFELRFLQLNNAKIAHLLEPTMQGYEVSETSPPSMHIENYILNLHGSQNIISMYIQRLIEADIIKSLDH
jgi:hypothetical protein